jgi:hypothetical protein
MERNGAILTFFYSVLSLSSFSHTFGLILEPWRRISIVSAATVEAATQVH